MTFLSAGLMACSLVCVLNLLLIFGVIRRLRQQGELLEGEQFFRTQPARTPTVAVGTSPGVFSATTTTEKKVSSETLSNGGGRTIVAFFSTDCTVCTLAVSEFAEEVARLRFDVDRTIAVVIGTEEDATSLVGQLEPVASVVVEPFTGPMASAFALHGVPGMCLLDPSGVVVATGRGVDELAVPSAV
ncbi:redoxin domain-containing protein [Actinomadura barringtoniae]|uniref:Redoxin domain-containing protein n=1 Tax=Actinomadura barringtoniae TaxID=1427535 RepID=A0A939T245_9ACTN|nr:redoxin domain-containing protein [Actinomadura barringtoniae]MBO2445928.1 redoxin domain-containing protein [Actinomadura barringtoniae]